MTVSESTDGCAVVGRDSVKKSTGRRADERRSDPGRLLSAFMRFVDSVRRNWRVRSAAQSSGSACRGTGLRRGTVLRSAMVFGSQFWLTFDCVGIAGRLVIRIGESTGSVFS